MSLILLHSNYSLAKSLFLFLFFGISYSPGSFEACSAPPQSFAHTHPSSSKPVSSKASSDNLLLSNKQEEGRIIDAVK